MKMHSAALFLGMLIASTGMAAPVLEFDFANNHQVVSPTDDIVIQGKVTNTGDEAFASGFYASSKGLTLPSPAFEQYYPLGIPQLWTNSSFGTIGIGDSITWTIVTLGTWPITGNPGDPVPGGAYEVRAGVDLTLAVRKAFGDTDNLLQIGPEDRFVWTVRDADSPTAGVPVPGSLLLLGAGLLGLGLIRQRAVS